MATAGKKAPVKRVAVKAKPAVRVLSPSERLDAIGIDAICERIVAGDSLRAWCIANSFSLQTTNDWIEVDKTRAGHYARARDDRADAVFESLDDVSEQAVSAESAVEVAGLRLKADNIKCKLARMNAKKYGDKQTIDLNAEVVVMSDDQRRARLAELQEKAGLLKK